MITNDSDANAHLSDEVYKNYMKIFLINSNKENNEDGFWQETENILKNFKYCQHCRINDNAFFNSFSFEQIPIRLKNESSCYNIQLILTF